MEGCPEELDRKGGLVVCTRVDETMDLQGGDEVPLKAEHEICREQASADVLASAPGLLALDSGALEKVNIRTITLI